MSQTPPPPHPPPQPAPPPPSGYPGASAPSAGAPTAPPIAPAAAPPADAPYGASSAAPPSTRPWAGGAQRPPLTPTASAGGPVGPLALEVVAVALGVALLTATVVLSAIRTRADGDLDWSNFLLGVAAALGLLGVAVAARLLVRDPLRGANLFAWPGAFGALAAGLMLAVLINDAWAAYPSGLLIVALSVAGYLFSRRPAFVISAIVGLAVVYLQLVDDLFDPFDFEDDSNVGLTMGVVVLVFTLLVTAGGWLLSARVYSGVFVGAMAVAAYVSVLLGVLLVNSFSRAFAGSEEGRPGVNRYDDDVWWIFGFSVLLLALWAFGAWVTGHVGFRILMVALVGSVVPLGTVVLAVEHPSWWELVLGLLGGGLLVAVGLRAMGDRVRRTGAPPAGAPPAGPGATWSTGPPPGGPPAGPPPV